MPQLDRLIQAMAEHRAEALILEQDQKPSLLLGGNKRPIVNTPLSAAQIAGLVGEIAPPGDRPAVQAGQGAAFSYATDGLQVQVEAGQGGQTVIRMGNGASAAPPAAAPATETTAAPGSRMDALFRMMVDRGASDLHLSSTEPPMLRIDGDMVKLSEQPELSPELVDSYLQEITPMFNQDEFKEHNDTDFAHEIEGLARFRCNIFRDRKGPCAVFRLIPSKIMTVDDLNLSQEIRNLCTLSKGLVLVTGPTGSGKSTTLTALVDLINRSRTDHIITIEDPIEFVHDNQQCLVNQREVKLHTRSFKQALRAALREDPDIVLVGELRDLETIAIALETAETGHLVFGTLHTTSAVSTVDRLVDQFPADQQEQVRVMLADSLRAVIGQVLCKRKGGGRVAALEVMMGLPSICNLIREGKTFQIPSIMQTGRKHGMCTFNDSLLKLVKDGVVEAEEAYGKALDQPNLLAAFKGQEIKTDFLTAKT